MAAGDDHTNQRGAPAPALTIESLLRAKELLESAPIPEPTPERPFIAHVGGRVLKYDGRGTFDAGPVPMLPMMGDAEVADDVLENPTGAAMRLRRRAKERMLTSIRWEVTKEAWDAILDFGALNSAAVMGRHLLPEKKLLGIDVRLVAGPQPISLIVRAGNGPEERLTP